MEPLACLMALLRPHRGKLAPRSCQSFEEICRAHEIRGAVPQIGVTPDGSSLLNLTALADAKDMKETVLRTILVPPRIIGAGIRL